MKGACSVQPEVYSVALYNLRKYTLVENNSERLPEDLFSVRIALFLIRRVPPTLIFLNAPFVFIMGMHSCFVWFKKLNSIRCFWLHKQTKKVCLT